MTIFPLERRSRTYSGGATWSERGSSRRKLGIPRENFYDFGRHGLSHQVPAAEGWVLLGTFYLAADTQGATMGGQNCFAMVGGLQARLD
ncbi:hypothetical protein AOQ72_16710 [Bradyrhizobium yuanmingense]|uniref:Uncharacterized protein n=1 Tax=Bradyrhizobium yuanmingense TaxID=108015 RepID=A0A0R3CRE1_9BRAD|nr:hypothetical protein AOQ72_16710 [Bradyrhizobium yuanmingense]